MTVNSACGLHGMRSKPIWIEVTVAKGWHGLVCSRCGEKVNARTGKIPKKCKGCGNEIDNWWCI